MYCPVTQRKRGTSAWLPDRKSPADVIDKSAENTGKKPASDQADNDGQIDPRQRVAAQVSLVGEMGYAMSHFRGAMIVVP